MLYLKHKNPCLGISEYKYWIILQISFVKSVTMSQIQSQYIASKINGIM